MFGVTSSVYWVRKLTSTVLPVLQPGASTLYIRAMHMYFMALLTEARALFTFFKLDLAAAARDCI